MTGTFHKRYFQNRLLASLPLNVIEPISPQLLAIDLPKGKILQHADQSIDTVYFIEEGICSVIATMRNGITVEIAIIGREGFIGIPVVLHTGRSLNQSIMAVAGRGFQISAKALIDQLEASFPLRASLLCAVQGLLAQSAQTSACNRVHELHQRLARWLLMCLDRVDTNRITITQEYLATMLGTRRSTVTVAAGILQKDGIIEYSRGHVTIKDRESLEAESCERDEIVHDEYVRLGLFPA